MSVEAPHFSEPENPTWRSKAWDRTRRGAAVLGRETKWAAKTAGSALLREAPTLLSHAAQLAETSSPEKARSFKSTVMHLGRVAIPIVVDALSTGVQERISTHTDPAFNATPENAPYPTPNQPNPTTQPDVTRAAPRIQV